jgi:hypothetical protein
MISHASECAADAALSHASTRDGPSNVVHCGERSPERIAPRTQGLGAMVSINFRVADAGASVRPQPERLRIKSRPEYVTVPTHGEFVFFGQIC